MMNASKTIFLSNVPGLTVFADDSIPGGFYALPKMPRIQSSDGLQMIQLLVYGRRAQQAFEVTGGLLACTTCLELTDDEKQTAAYAVRATLPEEQAYSVQLLPISWIRGSVSLKADFIPDLQGTPSLIAGNECALQAILSQSDAQELDARWRKEGYKLHVSYRVLAAARGPADFVIEGVTRGAPHEAVRSIRRIESP